MSEMNFKQITDKLNAEFTGDTRKLIFWYDEKAEFAEDIDTLELDNAKIYHLEKNNQFRTKLFLEREDRTTNYLIYAPFAKPDITENHLADTIRYSKEFFADLASLIVLDKNMDDRCKPVIQQYITFFGNKQRKQAFYDLEIGNYNRASIEIGLMSVVCKCKLPTFEEVFRCVLMNGEQEDNSLLKDFEKYDLLNPFWQQCSLVFGYTDEEPTLTKLLMTLFVTHAEKSIHSDLPQSWRPFVSFKSGSVIAFLDNLMNSVIYRECYDKVSAVIYKLLDGENQLKSIPVDALIDCDLFEGIDTLILQWLNERLVSENADAKLYGKTIPQICEIRRKKHYGSLHQDEYSFIENAWYIIKPGIYTHNSSINAIVKKYTEEFYKTDSHYRYFYYYYDKLEDNAKYQGLRDLVEKIYTNDYLNPLLADYSEAVKSVSGDTGIPKQRTFYNSNIKYSKDRIAVIISDAMRYEVGVSLYDRLQADEKCTASISVMQSTLPSVTRIGMAALLPHSALTIVDADTALVDKQQTVDIKQREKILQSANENSRAVRFDDIKNMNVDDLRGIFARQEVVYIYHDQIDSRGESLPTENEVFAACEDAIDEIAKLIRRLTTSANTSHFIITSDHGFIYKRDKLSGSDKIGGITGANDRFVISDTPVEESGVFSLPLKEITGTDDKRMISFPVGSDLFRAPGAGKNYVHGGFSPQETLLPVIDVKTEKAKCETTTASIDLVSLLNKITNLITTIDFIQSEPISDTVKEADYRAYFIMDSGEKISNEKILNVDKKDSDASKRMFRISFSFKNQKYDRSHKYYLVVVDNNNREIIRREVIMDIAFADDFGF